MNLQKHIRIFNKISSIYNLFFSYQQRFYSDLLNEHLSLLKLPENASILDIGCGTGALTQSLSMKGYGVTGVDIAENMIKHASKRGLNCQRGNVIDGLDFPDRSFDLVTSAYVAHGLDHHKRNRLFHEAARLSKGPVLFHDYNTTRSLPINFIEWLEDGDYFNFIKEGLDEMKAVFSKVEILPVRKYNNWYICTP
jgi:ubiquinone/menaquinone biosynthesis C-methylase UbiE